MFRICTRLLISLAATAWLTGCFSTYRMEIAQGNIITQDMVNQLRLGMTRSQVRFVLGSPMVNDLFHPNRWDYYYSLLKTGATKPETRLITVVFKNDMLARIEGDVAAKADSAATPTPALSGEAPK